MSEKRFTLKSDCDWWWVCDGEKQLHSENIVELLNDFNDENKKLKNQLNELELEYSKFVSDGEWNIRDITYAHGKFRLEEWGQRYHQFYDGNEELEDEVIVSRLWEHEKLTTENEQLKQSQRSTLREFEKGTKKIQKLAKENEQLKKQLKDRIKYIHQLEVELRKRR